MIMWNYVIVWVLAGCVTAGCVTWVCDVWTEKKISVSLLIGLIFAVALGWIGLAAMIMLASLASLVWSFEKYGNSTAFSWGKDED